MLACLVVFSFSKGMRGDFLTFTPSFQNKKQII